MELLTPELMIQIEEAEKNCWISYLSGVENIPGNPLGVVISSVGSLTAFLVKQSDSLFFNKALGIGLEHIEHLDDLLAFYHSNEKACTVETFPLPEYNEVYLSLAMKGLYSSEYTSMSFMNLRDYSKAEITNNIEIKPVSISELDILSDLHVLGFGFQGEELEKERTIVKAGYSDSKFKCYFAYINGETAATGVLFKYKNIGVLFGGATLPEFRGKGCQTALLHHRIVIAKKLGCDKLISHTNIYSPSFRNLERVGFKLASNRSRWTDYPIY